MQRYLAPGQNGRFGNSNLARLRCPCWEYPGRGNRSWHSQGSKLASGEAIYSFKGLNHSDRMDWQHRLCRLAWSLGSMEMEDPFSTLGMATCCFVVLVWPCHVFPAQ